MSRHVGKGLWILAGMVAFVSVTTFTKAASVTLVWDPSVTYEDGTALSDLQGYRLYSGTTNGIYTGYIDVSNATSVTISTLQPGCRNYFTVTAVSRSGIESFFSAEVSLDVPAGILVSTNELTVPEGTMTTFEVRLDAPPVGMTTVLVSRVIGGDAYLGVVSGAVMVFSPANWSSNQPVTLVAIDDPVKTNRTACFRLSAAGAAPAVVRATSTGTGEGMTAGSDGKDADTNGIPDAWEITRFGGIGIQGASAGDDDDHDGVSNIQEYIAGTDPSDNESRPLIAIQSSGGEVEVLFRALEAVGPGYSGRTRFYTLEQCTDLASGTWVAVAPATEISARNQMCSFVETATDSSVRFYRVRTRLE